MTIFKMALSDLTAEVGVVGVVDINHKCSHRRRYDIAYFDRQPGMTFEDALQMLSRCESQDCPECCMANAIGDAIIEIEEIDK